MDSKRDIQYYFLLTENGKLFYNRLFSHDMTSADAEEDGVIFIHLKKAFVKYLDTKIAVGLSVKTHIQLTPGPPQKDSGEESWTIFIDIKKIDIKKYSNEANEGYSVITRDSI